ncbi:MAG: hypothetical protein PHZ27_05210 [Candidatus Omnitrophica bacterium]|nr:hypothetical protein [Candidatus Omnitrophota bacterium]
MKKKKKWKKAEILVIKLNPEQAVLSCCDAVQKGVIPMIWTMERMCFSNCPGTVDNSMS